MQFSIGYPATDLSSEPFTVVVEDYKQFIAEVYFAWPGMASGRSPMHNDKQAVAYLVDDLRMIRSTGIQLNLLLNAACFGANALSVAFFDEVRSVVEYIQKTCGGLDIVTTTSPVLARVIKEHFPEIDTRASVNMRIGSIEGMQYVTDVFDSFYVRKECNRDMPLLERLTTWAQNQEKRLFLLANSGCLRHCSGQYFHDTLVAHENEIKNADNYTTESPYVCWNYLTKHSAWAAILQSTWIRPEDLHNYESLFPVVKLATRMHQQPRLVLEAYTCGKHYGNLLDLFEPAFSQLLSPQIMDNGKFPDDWFVRTSRCARECGMCNYCESVVQKIVM